MSRHNARIIGVMTLFNIDMLGLTPANSWSDILDNILTLEKEEEYPVKIDEDYAKQIIIGVVNNLSDIDELISKYLINYTIDRLSYVDRAIIRIATFEMKYLELPKTIAINEAIEITKEYSSIENDLQVKFTNRVLDNIAFGINKDKGEVVNGN